jgi:hypothetical protein
VRCNKIAQQIAGMGSQRLATCAHR